MQGDGPPNEDLLGLDVMCACLHGHSAASLFGDHRRRSRPCGREAPRRGLPRLIPAAELPGEHLPRNRERHGLLEPKLDQRFARDH